MAFLPLFRRKSSKSRKSLGDINWLPKSVKMAASLRSLLSDTDMVPMSDVHREVIRRSHNLLVRDLDVSDIIDEMIQNGIINDNKRQVIMAGKTRQERVRDFLDILQRSGAKAFPVFIDALRNVAPFLANAVESKLEELHTYDNLDDIIPSDLPKVDPSAASEGRFTIFFRNVSFFCFCAHSEKCNSSFY